MTTATENKSASAGGPLCLVSQAHRSPGGAFYFPLFKSCLTGSAAPYCAPGSYLVGTLLGPCPFLPLPYLTWGWAVQSTPIGVHTAGLGSSSQLSLLDGPQAAVASWPHAVVCLAIQHGPWLLRLCKGSWPVWCFCGTWSVTPGATHLPLTELRSGLAASFWGFSVACHNFFFTMLGSIAGLSSRSVIQACHCSPGTTYCSASWASSSSVPWHFPITVLSLPCTGSSCFFSGPLFLFGPPPLSLLICRLRQLLK